MHVAQFVQRYPPALGGSEAYTRRLCEYLAARGDDVQVWTSTAIELGEMWARGPKWTGVAFDGSARLTLSRFPPLHFPARRYLLKALSLVPHHFWQCLTAPCNPICPAMWRAANRFAGPLDAVHATAFPYSFPVACGLRLARRRGVPFLLTPFLHVGDPTDPNDRTRTQYTRPHLRWLLKQADRVFVQTRAERDAVAFLGVPPERVVLQGLGVDAGDCVGGNRERARSAWGVSGDVVVGHLANNSAEKGTVDLLRAAERLWASGHPLVGGNRPSVPPALPSGFRVVLAGPEMPNFRAFWDDFVPKNRVIRLGVLTDEQKRDFFAGIDCFVLPSRSDSFGLVLLEAWANAKANLVYRAGGPAELVRHEIDGLHAACGDVADLAAQLRRLVADAELRRRLGANGCSRIATEFRWADQLELVRETIREAVAEKDANRSCKFVGRVVAPPRFRESGNFVPPSDAEVAESGEPPAVRAGQ